MTLKLSKADFLLVGLTLYVAALVVLTIDQLFGPWILIPELDRQLQGHINNLTNPDAKVREKAREEIISYHEFSIPLLIKALKRDDPELRKGANECLVAIAKRFFHADNSSFGPDPERWREWWEATEARLDQAAPSPQVGG